MALINCPECDQKVSDQAASCPHCGYKINASTSTDKPFTKKHTGYKVIFVIALVLSIVGMVYFLYAAITYEPQVTHFLTEQMERQYSQYQPSYFLVSVVFLMSALSAVSGLLLLKRQQHKYKIAGIIVAVIALILIGVSFALAGGWVFVFLPLISPPVIATLICLLLFQG